MKHSLMLLLVLLCVFGLTGCGKKASRLDPPDSVVDDTYPQTYPNPDTDPKPTLAAPPVTTLRIAPTLPAPASQPAH